MKRSKRVRREYMRRLLETGYLDPQVVSDGAVEIGLPPIRDTARLPQGRRTEGAGCVYLVRSADGLYKIGSSRDTKNRLCALQTGSPVPLDLVLTIPTKQYTHNALEKTLHRHLAPKRVRGEWFNLSPTDIDRLRALVGE